MNHRIALVFAALAFACKKAPPAASSETDSKAPPRAQADAAAAVSAAPDATPRVDCAKLLAELSGEVSSAYLAKEQVGPYEDAIELWPGIPDACRNGEWYVLAAKLLAWGRVGTKLETSGVVLETRDEALAEAVDRGLGANDLTYVALTAAAGGVTKLPADACEVAEAEVAGTIGAALRETTDDARYVCGHAALAAGNATEAKARFDAIDDPGFYPDLDLRRAEVELALGNTKAARKLAKKAAALKQLHARWRFASSGDWKAIVDAAKAIAE